MAIGWRVWHYLPNAFFAIGLTALGFAVALIFDATPRLGIAGPNCAVDASIDSQEQEFLRLINDYRDDRGLAALALSSTLNKAAAWKAKDMATNDYFAHDDQIERTWSERIRDCGYTANTWIGENLAAGNSSAQATFDQWRNSPGHNANMLNENFVAIGIGRAQDAGSTYSWYWATDFGGVADQAPPAPPPGSDPNHNGDADCNGRTDTVDAALVLQVIARIASAGPCGGRADVNGDAAVGPQDALLILQYAAGIVPRLPV
jgi:hypothetical protein